MNVCPFCTVGRVLLARPLTNQEAKKLLRALDDSADPSAFDSDAIALVALDESSTRTRSCPASSGSRTMRTGAPRLVWRVE